MGVNSTYIKGFPYAWFCLKYNSFKKQIHPVSFPMPAEVQIIDIN